MRNVLIMALVMLAFPAAALAGGWSQNYQVTITNLTKGVNFTPILNATHSRYVGLFTLGEPASQGIADVAEGGDSTELVNELTAMDSGAQTVSTSGLLGPGESVTVTLSGDRWDAFSLAAMLVPTNDTFLALNSVQLPRWGAKTYWVRAYDAGSETNDELCMNIPGPTCGGIPFSPGDDGEGYIYPSPALHGEGDLNLSDHNWQGPVARVVITRVD